MSREGGARYGIYALVVLTLAYILAFIDRQLPSLLVEPIKRDLRLDDVRIGLLQGFGFALLLALAGLPLGRVIDSGRRTLLLAGAVMAWSLCTALSGLAQGFTALLFLRMGVGAAEAVMTPSAYSLIGDYLPGKRLGLWVSLYGMGAYLGSGLALVLGSAVLARLPAAGVVLPGLGPLQPWRFAFLMVGAPGLVVALWVLSLVEPPRRLLAAEPERATLADIGRYVRASLAALAPAHVGVAFSAMGLYALMAWVPAMLARRFHASHAEVGAVGLEIIVAGPLGALFAGIAGDALRRLGLRNGRVGLAAAAAAAAAPFAVYAVSAADLRGVLMGLLPLLFCATMVVASGPAILQEITPNRMRGVQHATAVLVVNVLGLGLGPLAVALVSEHGPADGGLAFALAACLPVMFAVSAVLLAAATWPYRAVHQRFVAG